jgi:hypothetical protein
MPPKAYRWVGEMEEIASFVAASLDKDKSSVVESSSNSNSTPSGSMGQAHLGLAALFERIAADLRATGTAVGGAADGPKGDAAEIEALHAFADDGKALLASKGYKKA